MIKLTIPFDTIMQEAADRKKEKYKSLVTSIKQKGYPVTLITIVPEDYHMNKALIVETAF